MIYIMIMGLLFMGIVATTMFHLLNTTESVSEYAKNQEGYQQLAQWESIISNQLRPYGKDKALVAPYGVNDPTDADGNGDEDIPYHLLPDGFGMNKYNQFGMPLIYCPVSDDTDLSTVNNSKLVWNGDAEGDSRTYVVDTMSDHTGRIYVTKSNSIVDASLQNQGVVAIIISPLPTSGALPRCQDVSLNSKNLPLVSGGVARIIWSDRLLSDAYSIPTNIDADVSDLTTTVNQLFSSWQANQPSKMTLYLPGRADSYDLNASLDLISEKINNALEIEIIGDGSSSSLIGSSSGAVTLSFENVNVKFKDIGFEGGVKFKQTHGKLVLEDSTLNSIELNHTILETIGNNTINNDSGLNSLKAKESFVDIKNGTTLNVYSSGFDDSGVLLDKSELSNKGTLNIYTDNFIVEFLELENKSSFNNLSGTILFDRTDSGTTKTNDGIRIEDSSSFYSADGIITMQAPLIDSVELYGEMVLDNTDIVFSHYPTNGIVMLEGSSLVMRNNSTLGSGANMPQYGIKDSAGRYIGGSSAHVYSSMNCWDGNLFTMLSNASVSSYTNSTPYNIMNRSNWNCN